MIKFLDFQYNNHINEYIYGQYHNRSEYSHYPVVIIESYKPPNELRSLFASMEPFDDDGPTYSKSQVRRALNHNDWYCCLLFDNRH